MEGKGQDSIDWGGVEAIDMPDEAELEGQIERSSKSPY